MTAQEFKAWFDGFSENIKGVPSAKQWARVKERASQIDGVTITREVVREYWPHWYPYYASNAFGTITPPSVTEVWSSLGLISCHERNGAPITSSSLLMNVVGREEATSL